MALLGTLAFAQDAAPKTVPSASRILISNVRIFDGKSDSIWPSGAFISQTGGHGDFRLPTDFPAKPGDYT